MRRDAGDLKSVTFWRNIKFTIIIIVIVVAILLIIILPLTINSGNNPTTTINNTTNVSLFQILEKKIKLISNC